MTGTRRRGLLQDLKRNRLLFLMILPAVVYFFVFQYIPMAGIVVAFKQFNIRQGLWGSPWSGLANFRFLTLSGKLGSLLLNTFAYNLVFMLLQNLTAVAFAIAINESVGVLYKKISQSVTFLPYFVSYVILQAFVYNLFNFDFGFVNNVIESLGGAPVNFYAMPALWPFIITFFHLWKWVGYGSVVYLAVIVGIDPQLYEAAKMDGAGIFQRIRIIVLPHIAPAFTVLLLFQTGRIMRGQFELFYNIVGSNGQLFDVTDVIDTYVFRSLVESFDVGMASAAGLLQSAMGFAIILLVNRMVKAFREDYALF